MEILLVILAFLFLLTGLLGAVVPVLPGPPISFVGLLLLQWSGYGNFSSTFLLVWAAITVAITIIDYVLPALMTKKFGGSRAAVIGSVVGFIVGMIFFPPMGLLVGSFLGAFAGELINIRIHARLGEINNTGPNSTVKALKVALGSFLAFIMGTGAKLIISAVMIYYAVKELIK